MNFWKKLLLNLIYPHLAIILMFLPVAISLLTYSLIYFEPASLISIISYILAFYMLVVLCFRVPRIIEFFKTIKHKNKYIKKYFSDVHLRVNISLYGSLIWNCAFAIFQLGLGFYHNSLWFYSMAAYYVVLATMRFFLLKHTQNHSSNEKPEIELKKYTICGWLLLLVNFALTAIIVFIVYWNRTFNYHEITTIALAAYTFTTFTFAIINIVKYRKYNSPIYSASKSISLIAACVSMLTLETTMLTTFGGTDSASFRQLMLALTGAAVSIFTIFMALYMIIKGTINLKRIKHQL